jgi:hypothetical protein
MPLPQIPLRCYPCFHACHLANAQNTVAVEALGAAVITSGPGARGQLLPQFIQQVCHWGGRRGPSIAVRVLEPANNLPAERLARFNSAINALAAGNILTAINEIVSLYGFGISFGSKQLRMLRPDLCGVLDGLVREECGYANTPQSYVQYCLDCLGQATALNAAGIFTSGGQPWNAGAVDMAVFAWIQTRRLSWNCRCGGDDHALSNPCALGAAPRLDAKADSAVRLRQKIGHLKEISLPQTCDTNATPPTGLLDDLFIKKKARYFALKLLCIERPNIGALEALPPNHPDGTVNAKQDLVEKIAAQGGNFLVQPGFNPAVLGSTRRVSGTGYVGWRQFGTIDAAIQYLRIYFTVRACNNATRQAIVDHGGPLLPY